MIQEGYRLISRLISVLSLFCVAFLFYPVSLIFTAVFSLWALILLIPKLKIPGLKSISLPKWLLAAFAGALLASSDVTFESHPHFLILILSAFICVPGLAVTADLISRISSSGIKAAGDIKENDTRINLREILIIFFGSAVIITMMSSSSPIYPYNYWDDANIFFTMGRGIKHGLVLYKDIYDQKGPSIFFAHAAAAFISERSFLGVWILEIIENFFFGFFSWKIVKLYIKPSSFTIITIPCLLSVLCYLSSFYFGDSAEEMCLPFLAAVFYMSLKYVKSEKELPVKHAFITGILTGFVFWLKYTMCGFILGLALFIVIDMIARKKIGNLLRTVISVTGGIAAFTAPVILYFALNGALKDLFTSYFYNNIFYYTAITDNSNLLFSGVPVIGTVIRMFTQMSWDLGRITGGFILLFISASVLTGFKKRSILLFLSCFSCTSLGIYIGSTVLYYYCHLLMVFVPLSLIPAIVLLAKADSILSKRTGLSKIILSSGLALAMIMNILTSANFFFLTTVQKEDLPQYKFARIMEATPSPKILNYDVLDIGLYTFTDSLPANRFFCYLNIEESMTDIKDEQNRLIGEGYFDYIVAMSPDYDWDNYEIVSYEHFQFLGIYKKLVADDFYLYARTTDT